mgnify:FL=1
MLTITLFFIWLEVIFYELNYFLYFWQKKDYRADRFLIDFKENKGKVFLNKWIKIKICALFLLLILSVISYANYISLSIIYILIVLYLLNLLYLLLKTQFKKPIFTKKTILIFLLTFITIVLAGIDYKLQVTSYKLLILDILLLPILSFWILFFIPFSNFAKALLVKKAIKKREDSKNLISIGITGSFGKSSTKEFLAKILSYKYKVAFTREHENTEVGVARAILQMAEDTEIFVAEMGAYKERDIFEISQVVKPTYGIITGINEQHLALQGKVENIINTKFELAEKLPKRAILLINKQALKYNAVKAKIKIYNKILNIIKYSDTDISKIKETIYGLEFIYKKNIFKTRIIGAHLIPNILGAIIMSELIGMDISDIKKAVKNLTPLKSTFFVKTFGKRFFKEKTIIIDDTYSANSTGVLSALDFMDRLGKNKNKILIMRSLVDLGEKGKETHKKIGKKISLVCDCAFIIDNNFKQELKSEKTIFTNDIKQIIKKIKEIIKNKDAIILLENRLPKEILNFFNF